MVEAQFKMLTGSMNEKGNCTAMGYNEMVIGMVDYSVTPMLTDEKLLALNLEPIFMAYTLEVKRPQKRGEVVTGRQVATRRENDVIWSWTFSYMVGEELTAVARVYMGICDMTTHKLCRDINPYVSEANLENCSLLSSESRIPFALEGEKMETIHVKKSYLDALGHTNQKHYLEFCYDNMLPEHQAMDTFHRVEVYYLGELREGNSVDLYRSTTLSLDVFSGIRDDGKPSFQIRFHF